MKHERTSPYRPQTNGKVERNNRIRLEEWAYARPYAGEREKERVRSPATGIPASLQSSPRPHRTQRRLTRRLNRPRFPVAPYVGCSSRLRAA